MMTVAVRGWSASSGSIRPLVAAWWTGVLTGQCPGGNWNQMFDQLPRRWGLGSCVAQPAHRRVVPPDSAVECSPGDAGSALAWAVAPAGESDYLASAVPMTFAMT
jgi:hypothetical protein